MLCLFGLTSVILLVIATVSLTDPNHTEADIAAFIAADGAYAPTAAALQRLHLTVSASGMETAQMTSRMEEYTIYSTALYAIASSAPDSYKSVLLTASVPRNASLSTVAIAGGGGALPFHPRGMSQPMKSFGTVDIQCKNETQCELSCSSYAGTITAWRTEYGYASRVFDAEGAMPIPMMTPVARPRPTVRYSIATCTCPFYATEVCIPVALSGDPTNPDVRESSAYASCYYPFAAGSFPMSPGPPPAFIKLSVRSQDDPYIAAQRLSVDEVPSILKSTGLVLLIVGLVLLLLTAVGGIAFAVYVKRNGSMAPPSETTTSAAGDAAVVSVPATSGEETATVAAQETTNLEAGGAAVVSVPQASGEEMVTVAIVVEGVAATSGGEPPVVLGVVRSGPVSYGRSSYDDAPPAAPAMDTGAFTELSM